MESTPLPSKWSALPFYMRAHFIITLLSLLWGRVSFVLKTNRRITRSRLDYQRKSTTFFSDVLVPILEERGAAKPPQDQQLVQTRSIVLRMSIRQ